MGSENTTMTTVITLPLPWWWSRGHSVSLDMAETGDITRVIVASLLITLVAQWLSHLLCRHALPQQWRRAYERLPRAKRDEWNTRVCSSVHAVLVSGWVGMHACVAGVCMGVGRWEIGRFRSQCSKPQRPHTCVYRLVLHALWAEAPGIMLDTMHRSAEAPFAIAITTGYLLGDALLVLYSCVPHHVQRRCVGWEYGPISAPLSTLAHHLVGTFFLGEERISEGWLVLALTAST